MDKRKVIGIILGVIIIVTAIFVFLNKDTIFTRTVTVKYPDGCKEIYNNDVLSSSLCTNGRMLAEANRLKQQQQQQNNYLPNTGLNINWTK